jgi:hypothetical protein
MFQTIHIKIGKNIKITISQICYRDTLPGAIESKNVESVPNYLPETAIIKKYFFPL